MFNVKTRMTTFIKAQLKKAMIRRILTSYWHSGIDYRVASLFTRYLTVKGIKSESLKPIGQF